MATVKITGAQAKRLGSIKRQLMRAGWRMRWDTAQGHWEAIKYGFIIHHTDAEHLLTLALACNPPAPEKRKRAPRKGAKGRRPRLDLDQENLFRCGLDDPHRVPCLALVWRRDDDMREHLIRYHANIKAVAGMSDASVRACFEVPIDVPDDGTGEE